MRRKTRQIFIFVLPVVIMLVAAIVLSFVLIPKEVTTQDYYNSLTKSNYTKHVQTTTMMDGQAVVYEKVETLIFAGNNVYHKIQEKTMSLDADKYYDETTEEYYYTKNKMYYKESDVWQIKDFVIKENLKTYQLKDSYFETLEYEKEIIAEGTLKGKIKDKRINSVLGVEGGFVGGSLSLKMQSSLDVLSLNITGKTVQGRDVSIKNIYSYDRESVSLPQL